MPDWIPTATTWNSYDRGACHVPARHRCGGPDRPVLRVANRLVDVGPAVRSPHATDIDGEIVADVRYGGVRGRMNRLGTTAVPTIQSKLGCVAG